MGAPSLAQLNAEVLDWNLYSSRRKIGCLAGMVPSQWSTGEAQRLGSITKVGLPAIRRIITEMVWRMILFEPEYKPVQKWREVLEGPNRGLKKKAVVAIGRQLIVDSRGGYRPAADSRYLATANRTYHRPRIGSHHDRGLSHFGSDPKNRVLTWGSAPTPGWRGTAKQMPAIRLHD